MIFPDMISAKAITESTSGHISGNPIYAADNGVVVFAGWSDRGYGNLVIIDHMDGWHTFYAHLNAVNVNCGADVCRNDCGLGWFHG